MMDSPLKRKLGEPLTFRRSCSFGLFKRWSAALITLTLVASAHAVRPESGLYWQPITNGTGYSIEIQGDVATLIIYTFDNGGQPVFYFGSGPIQDGGTVEQVAYIEGYLPTNSLGGELYRLVDGLPFGHFSLTPPGFPQNSAVGSFLLTFGYYGSPFLEVFLPTESGGVARSSTVLKRYNFGYPGFGTNQYTGQPCFVDMRGEWVVVDESDPLRAPWRFNFTEVSGESVNPFTCPGDLDITFRDPVRQAVLHCERTNRPPPGVTLKYDGCELTQDAQIVFNINRADLGLERFVGSLGELPLEGSEILRRPQRVIGIRVGRSVQ